jgi:serine/arginine repetitive matrix protein 2
VLLSKNSPPSTSIGNSWKRLAPRRGLLRYPHHLRLQRSWAQQVRREFVCPADSTSPMNTSAKSPPPPTTSHSRLVTTKLTKLPSSSTGTGPGWTRPSSTTPSVAPSPVSGAVSSAPPAPAPIAHGPPQLPHAGKVIQPQPRGATQIPSTSKSEITNGSSKPAWRNVKPGGTCSGTGPPPGVQSEFPTAAESVQGAFVRYRSKSCDAQHFVLIRPQVV